MQNDMCSLVPRKGAEENSNFQKPAAMNAYHVISGVSPTRKRGYIFLRI